MNKKIKKFLNCFLIVVVTLSMVNPVFALGMPFTDVPEGGWFYDYVKYVNDHGLMTGLNPTTFGPTENLARAQFATILYRQNYIDKVVHHKLLIQINFQMCHKMNGIQTLYYGLVMPGL